jgi:hypothetical protein
MVAGVEVVLKDVAVARMSHTVSEGCGKVTPVTQGELNPLQTDVLDALGLPEGWQPLPADVVDNVERHLLSALSDLAEMFEPENPLRVNKHYLSTVHGCQTHHMAIRAEPFAWNINTVRGTIVHKAIELLLNWRTAVAPGDVVDAAITSVADNPRESASDFLSQLSAHEMAELRGVVVGAVSNFVECFPPIKTTWRPLVEYSARYEMFDRTIILTSRMDLVLGAVGRKVIIDLKTGRITPTHRDDLRFYALVETLRSRQPPRQLGTYSLDAARLDHEEVTEALLMASVRRTADGIRTMAELVKGVREPSRRAGTQCYWCPLNDSCEEGLRFLRQQDGESTDDDYDNN